MLGSCGGPPRPGARTMASAWDEGATNNVYDGSQLGNFLPVRRERANEELPITDARQSQLNAWSEENGWRVCEVSW